MKKSVAVDLDGVLLKYDGWKGLEHLGEPIVGAKEFLEKLREDFYAILHTTRLAPKFNDRPDQSYLYRVVSHWMDSCGLPYDELWVDKGKPLAIAYVDDRAVSCRPQDDHGEAYAYIGALREIQKLAEGAK